MGAVIGLRSKMVHGSFNQGNALFGKNSRDPMCLYGIICNLIFNYQGNKQMGPV